MLETTRYALQAPSMHIKQATAATATATYRHCVYELEGGQVQQQAEYASEELVFGVVVVARRIEKTDDVSRKQ
jgi:hypothetical protein